MTIIRKQIISLTIFLLIVLPLSVVAGDYSTLNFIGFSKDSRYLAFEEYGWQDGSGFPFSNIFLIDVAKNSFAAPPVKVLIENERATEVSTRSKAKSSAARNLKKFKIINGNTGTLVVARLVTDIDIGTMPTGESRKNQVVTFTEVRKSDITPDFYELSLTTTEIKLDTCSYSYEPAATVMSRF